MTKIDWTSVRERLDEAAVALEIIPPAEVDAAKRLTDRRLSDGSELVAFAGRHGVSLDWLVTGSVVPLLRYTRARMRAEP